MSVAACVGCKNVLCQDVLLLGLLADVGKDAAIYIKYVAVDGVRGGRCEEHCGTAELLRVEPTASGGLGADE